MAGEHSTGTPPGSRSISPHMAVLMLLALQHLALDGRQQLDQLELAARELHGAALDEGLELRGADLDLAGGANPPPTCNVP